jgi:hypothetical protein
MYKTLYSLTNGRNTDSVSLAPERCQMALSAGDLGGEKAKSIPLGKYKNVTL